MINENPFLIKGYTSKVFFCDRELELSELFKSCENASDVTLVSPRRMGKTGLMYRFFEELKNKKTGIIPIYVDIYATRSLADFVKAVTEAAIAVFPERESLGKKFFSFLKLLRPQISFDPMTGSPQIQISYQSSEQKERTLKNIFDFLDAQGKPILFAFDEFQQICGYPEKNMEHLLRTYIQPLKNLHFIFSGSQRHLMAEMFTSAKRPFYSSTKLITLDKINEVSYRSFIRQMFEKGGKRITPEAIDFILEWTRRHTYYTQSLCHEVYAGESSEISVEAVRKACVLILQMNAPVYLQYRKMLTTDQWNYLIAIAKEGSVSQITANKFLTTYKISSAAASRRLAKALCEKELLLDVMSNGKTTYSVYDVYMSRWLEKEY